MTVYYNGGGLIVDDDIATELGLKNGDTIKTEREFWHILKINANAMIAIYSAKIQLKIK